MYKRGSMVSGKWVPSTHELKHRAMMARCKVDGSYQENKPTYIGCEVSDSFKDFQAFAAWCESQIGFAAGFSLDKDLLGGGKLYSEATCVFLPAVINAALKNVYRKTADLPPGVVFRKASGRYLAQGCPTGSGKVKHLGSFESAAEASLAYSMAKTKYIRSLADVFKNDIDPRAYVALKEWEGE